MSHRPPYLAVACLFLVGLIGGQHRAAAQYSPFQPDGWDSVMNCEDPYVSTLSGCNSSYSDCSGQVALGIKTAAQCANEYGLCRTNNADTWNTCIGKIPLSDPVNPFCDQARARRDSCYQYMDYCQTLALAPEDQAICDQGAYYCTVTSGVSQCE